MRVPDGSMSMAGKTRLSAIFRSSLSSALPVPLNSSKITVSIMEPGLHQRGGDDGQRAAVLDVAGRAEEPLGRVERGRVDTTGQDPARRRRGQVVRPTQPGDRVEQHDHVVTQLDQPLGPLDGQLGDRGVVLRRPVEGGGDDLTLHRALHVGDLLGPLVDEHDHQVALRVVRA